MATSARGKPAAPEPEREQKLEALAELKAQDILCAHMDITGRDFFPISHPNLPSFILRPFQSHFSLLLLTSSPTILLSLIFSTFPFLPNPLPKEMKFSGSYINQHKVQLPSQPG